MTRQTTPPTLELRASRLYAFGFALLLALAAYPFVLGYRAGALPGLVSFLGVAFCGTGATLLAAAGVRKPVVLTLRPEGVSPRGQDYVIPWQAVRSATSRSYGRSSGAQVVILLHPGASHQLVPLDGAELPHKRPTFPRDELRVGHTEEGTRSTVTLINEYRSHVLEGIPATRTEESTDAF